MLDPELIDLPSFLTNWYGPPTKTPKNPSSTHSWLPEPLKRWHYLASLWDARLTYTTVMISLDEIESDEDGTATFMLDSTGDWKWCFDVANPDTVFDAEEYETWEKNSENLSQLLVHNTVRETVFGASCRIRCTGASDQTLSEILDGLDEIGFPKWRWPASGFRLFIGPETLVEVGESGSGSGWDVGAAATDRANLSKFRGIADADWREPGR
ncbi:hypothetical protein [Actinoplanes rectilineatus]|uniref:hypothetical protein n=1 Tax=Actinoplanes rectilineatus TaxID=113571 RepID=UPI0012F7BDEE|nr:hypothetical protein [Actinoplanes rectilineatus]